MLQGLVSPARGKLSLLYFKLSQASNGCKKRFLQGGRPPIDRQDDDALTGTSGVFLEEMEALWNRHREAVGPAWQEFFSKYSKDNLVGSNLNSKGLKTSSTTTDKNSDNSIHGTHVSECADHVIEDYMKVQLLIRAYQVRGHLKAQIDPLGIMQPNRDFSPAPELELEYYGFGPSDLNRSFKLGPGVLPAFQKKNFQGSTTMTLLQIYQALHRIYCGTIGYEYTHIPDRDKCDWLRARIEVPRAYNFDIHKKKIILDRLTWADGLERFLATKFPGEKRFGLEGGESLVPGMKALIDRSVLSSSELSQLENLLHPEFNHHDKNIKSSRGVDHIVIGMAHRGRLNVLANVVRKPLPSILCEFAGRSANETANNHSGDVKYHLGMTYTRPTPSGRPVCISLVANPSHLEAASPVVLGKVRALQFYAGDTPPFSLGSPTKMRYDSVESHNCAMAILIHGDAAFAGQGVVCEALGLSALPHYSTGGTIHIIVNNQIGFTTDPRFARSSPYCSDLAKTIAAPILHVNGSDVEAVVHACELAADWRRVFKTDVVIDLVCFRRFGHNEVDQPAFTQPRMCAAIARQPSCLEQYVKNICDSPSESKNDTEALGSSKSAVNKQPSGSSIYLNEDLDFQSPENNDSKNSEFSKISVQSETKILHKEFLKIQQKVKNFMEEAYALSKTYQPTNQDWLASSWPGFRSPKELLEDTPCLPPDTGLDIAKLKQIGTRAASFPPTFAAHPGVARIMSARRRILETGEGIDMATAESLAFGTLLAQGSHVRLSGQDVERGTFSQRHAVLHQQAPFEHSSHLSNAEANVQNNIKILNKNLDRTDENVDKNATVMVENRQQTSPNVERQYIPLQNVSEGQARFVVCNSSLSEFGVLGFELGYSLVDPKALILWEAQFGDFCNGAQVIIDQFLASGERKWLQRTGLVMLLPHGYDGAGPEHSNARIDRFLSLCDDNPYSYPSIEKLSGVKDKTLIADERAMIECNMQIVYCTTPANYYHVLRRQILRDYRKPLILFTSKSLLRHPNARSSLSDMGPGTSFMPVISDESCVEPDKVERIILCTGQVYYALLKARNRNEKMIPHGSIAIVRVEQLSPFPAHHIVRECERYPNASQIVWCQEEPLNMGMWFYVEPRLETAFKSPSAVTQSRETLSDGSLTKSNAKSNPFPVKAHAGKRAIYAGRPPNAGVATGLKSRHVQEEHNLLASALLKEPSMARISQVDTGVPVWETL